MSERQNEQVVGQVLDGEWQEVRCAVYDYGRRPYISLAVYRMASDGGSFLRGFSLRQALWTDLIPLIQKAIEEAKAREEAGAERAAYDGVLPVHGWRRPR